MREKQEATIILTHKKHNPVLRSKGEGYMTYSLTVKNKDAAVVCRAEAGALLSAVLSENGFAVPAACAGRGVCNKCAVKVLSGVFDNVTPDENGKIKSCRARVASDAVIEADFSEKSEGSDFTGEGEAPKNVCGIAVDIGTTTVAAAFVNKKGELRYASCINPQSAYGADVISRISACAEGKLAPQTERIRRSIAALMRELDPAGEAEELTVAGNTTMLHIFCGVSPESMGVYPFTPAFTDAVHLTGAELGLSVKKVTVLPCVSAFIGADITAGMYVLGLHKTEKRVLLADLGTNGEIVFSDAGKLLCTSAAAGPALEGACIECGTGGVPGAINRVYKKNGVRGFTVIGSTTGICGAGLADAVALMLSEGVLDETGYLEEEYYLADNVYISPADIRQLQLAKSAVCSAVERLLESANILPDTVDELFIAGGLGYYMSPESAFACGILPRFPKAAVTAAGNTSLRGALRCIGNASAVEEMRSIAKNCSVAELGGDPRFNELFAENMFFATE